MLVSILMIVALLGVAAAKPKQVRSFELMMKGSCLVKANGDYSCTGKGNSQTAQTMIHPNDAVTVQRKKKFLI